MASGRKGPQNDEQLGILREIWNEMKSLNGRIDGLRGDVQRLDARFEQASREDLDDGLELEDVIRSAEGMIPYRKARRGLKRDGVL